MSPFLSIVTACDHPRVEQQKTREKNLAGLSTRHSLKSTAALISVVRYFN